MALILGTLFAGVTYIAHVYKLTPSHDQTLISQLGSAIFGNSIFYYILQTSTALILFLAASTSYADFPRLSSLLAKDRFAPRQLAILGDRLVFSNGIIGLSVAAILLIILFKGQTHQLIPLYAVGVFLSFTLSQSGMVVHHIKYKEKGWLFSLFFNAFGAIATGVVLVVIAASKFTHGAWMVIVTIPAIVFVFTRIQKHYLDFARELVNLEKADLKSKEQLKQVVVLPISGIHKGVVDAYTYAHSISQDVRVCIVEIDEEQTERLKTNWVQKFPDEIVILKSPFRSVVAPLLKYIDKVLRNEDIDFVTVVLPEFVTAKWYHQFLHNQTAFIIKAALIFKPKVIVTSVRYHLKTT